MRKIRLRLRNFKSELGATIAEAAIAIAILGVTAIGMNQFFTQTIRAQKQAKLVATMEFLAQDIENKLKNPSSIYLSLLDGGNNQFNQCLLGYGAGCRTALTTVGNRNLFALNYATGTATLRRVTQPNANYQYYSALGLPCQRGAQDCVFWAETFFYASCDPSDGNYPQCFSGPAQVHVGYTVHAAPGTMLRNYGDVFRDIPRTAKFFTHQMKDVLGVFTNATCRPGAVITGYDRRGLPKCECKPPNFEIARDPRYGPLCQGLTDPQLTCPNPGQIYRGVRGDGTALCEDPNAVYDCIDYGPSLQGSSCPTGYWVQQDMRPNYTRWPPVTGCPTASFNFGPSAGCSYWCSLPDIRGGSFDCSSNEAADNRCGGGEQGIVNYSGATLYSYLNTTAVGDEENPPNAMWGLNNAVVRKGLVCPHRRLTCCTQKP